MSETKDKYDLAAIEFIKAKINAVINRREERDSFTAKDSLEEFIYYHAPEKYDSDLEPFIERLASATRELTENIYKDCKKDSK